MNIIDILLRAMGIVAMLAAVPFARDIIKDEIKTQSELIRRGEL